MTFSVDLSLPDERRFMGDTLEAKILGYLPCRRKRDKGEVELVLDTAGNLVPAAR